MRGAPCSSFGGLHRLTAFAILLHACAGIVTGTSPKEGYALTTMDMLTMDGAQARVVSVNGGLKTVIFMHDTAEAPSELALQSLCELRHNETQGIPCAAAVYSASLSIPIVPTVAGGVAFAPLDEGGTSSVDLPGFGCTHHGGQEESAMLEASTLLIVRRGGCSFADKARFAQSGGYVGLVVVGSGEPIAPSLGDEDTNFPVVMVSSDSPLLDLLKTDPASASLHLDFFGGGLGSTDAEAVFWYGDFLRQSKEVYAAAYHYAKALSLEPAFLDAAWALANAWFSLNATQEAHRALDFASSERAPDFVEVVHRDLEAAARRMRKLHGYEESSTQSGTSLAQRVHVVAVATKYKPQLDMLKRSVEVQGPGWTLDVIGGGVVYAGRYGAHGGIKIELLLEWLQPESNNVLHETDIVLFVDAYDVAFLPGMGNELIRRFLAFDAGVVTGGDNNCYPDRSAELLLETLESLEGTLRKAEKEYGSSSLPESIPAPYLNSGTFIGRALDLRLMLERIVADAKPHYNDIGKQLVDAADQRLLTRYWMSHPGHLKVDHFGELFQTLHDIPKKHFRVARPSSSNPGQMRLWSSATGVEVLTCVLHGNGNGFSAFSDLVTEVGLSESAYEDHGFLAV